MTKRSEIILSIVIPCKTLQDPKLWDLVESIRGQDFPQEKLEILTITEGTSESAKAIGIRKSQGKIICILASDNKLVHKNFLTVMYQFAGLHGSAYPAYYAYMKDDDILNRYFALVGCNDPLPLYLGKNDKFMVTEKVGKRPLNATYGDNGFFIKKNLIEKTDLDNYFHIDNIYDLKIQPYPVHCAIWHKTGGNIFKFFAKRYRYGMQHAFNPKRRWHMVEKEDIPSLLWFIFCTVTLIQPIWFSIKGYRKVKDKAWLLHSIVCMLTLSTYGVLMIRVWVRSMFQSSSVR